MSPSLAKPPACDGCSLADRGTGFTQSEGPLGAPLAFVAESAGKVETLTGRPLVGDAGGMFQRLLNLLGLERSSLRLDNCIRCRPPHDWMDERAPWYYTALQHCRYVDETLSGGSKVVVTLGNTALKRVLGLVGHKKIRVQDWHGTITRDPTDRFWVVPTYHPSFLQRGAHNLIGTAVWDIQQAQEAVQHGKPADAGVLYVDPPLEQFRAWVDQVVAARQQDPEAYPISSDVETPDKAGGKDEGEITAEDRSQTILRQNVTCHPDEGWTVPQVEPFISELHRLYASPGPIWEWNREYDFERQVRSGGLTEADSPRVVDLMWLWHFLQSDLPRGLGFVAPFYSTWGAWKHLAATDPTQYAAIDALQNHRIGFGVTADLIKLGVYDRAMSHTHVLHTRVLRPAQLVGVKIHRERLLIFKEDLTKKASIALEKIQACVPEAVAPLTPKAGMKKKPLANVLHVKASAFTRKGTKRAGKEPSPLKLELYAKAEVVEKIVIKEVLVCRTCGAIDIQRRHRCRSAGVVTPAEQSPDGLVQSDRQIELGVASVTRYFWKEPFNPDSPKQVLAYILHRKHTPGKAKKTHEDTTNRETLERLSRSTKDPFYAALLDYRAVMKVKGTYVEGTERRLDANDRLHPQPTFKPSTQRLSYVNPNITNVVADKGGEEGIAAGFRHCVVAEQVRPAGVTDEDLDRWTARWLPGADWRQVTPTELFATKLLEVDFAAIEAVLTGYAAGDREYMRLAQLGVHAALASHVLGRPYDPAWQDEEIASYFAAIKADHPEVYDPAKRYIHGKNYGLTNHGAMRTFPHLFPTESVIKKYEKVFLQMAPKVPAWQLTTQRLAARQKYLGGSSHPFGYTHHFHAVYTYRRLNTGQYYKILAKCRQVGVEAPVTEINGQYFRIADGEDAKRALAFFGQSVGAGVLKEVCLRLLADPTSPYYVGDAWFGHTPFRAPIHDSGLFEIPMIVWMAVVPIILREFLRPVPELPLPVDWGMGPYLGFGVAAKAGEDWKNMEKVPIHGVLQDEAAIAEPIEPEDADDFADLERRIG